MLALLADEPTGGLDTRTTRRVLALFRGIAQTQGTTFVIVSHDPLVAENVDLAYDLHDGKLIARQTERSAEPGAANVAELPVEKGASEL